MYDSLANFVPTSKAYSSFQFISPHVRILSTKWTCQYGATFLIVIWRNWYRDLQQFKAGNELLKQHFLVVVICSDSGAQNRYSVWKEEAQDGVTFHLSLPLREINSGIVPVIY